ncbi:hypothetical protein COT99_02970 [Candidatus Falkowbacteria bacterium CG10_big_fil_rev_8_21_14_0_10_43_10]|uniref:Uncharacterized protein n=1 Tax=Candidatus Falkowbacteria bacterium CG10_big_fil_rev_8_21_14_0_10_43_10 TaxID=1974567 RepID=A0A2H0V1V2_9BACT|nr:MAG: hypothetical protein COT99_02970 [Candidatus Falkowbacteria bacterium CG10_big_fil_rev_8_21_14_0_10_43_10]
MNGRALRRTRNPLILQPRDAELVKNAFRYRFLTSVQARGLCGFSSQKRTNDRLRKLYDGRLLSRRLFINSFTREILHFPGPKAPEILSSLMGIEPLEVKRKRERALKTRDSFISHFLLTNRFRYSLEMAKKFEPGVKLDVWKYKPPLFLTEKERVFPDAYLLFQYGDKNYPCFLEADHSVESRQRIKKKIKFYLDLGMSGCLEKRFGFRHFRLLIIAKTLMRLKSLLKIIEKTTDKSFCWLTIEKNITPEKILSDIWFRSNKEGMFSLIT